MCANCLANRVKNTEKKLKELKAEDFERVEGAILCGLCLKIPQISVHYRWVEKEKVNSYKSTLGFYDFTKVVDKVILCPDCFKEKF
ncbi:hypothetical protein AKJ43_02825 [candidate division MSBL1 archaeon SCGC-AAA261D19]|nr:hypothetical protein AKJ43_02825 [candidate division MSBL1 archaeon SCGC-AAA261D19]